MKIGHAFALVGNTVRFGTSQLLGSCVMKMCGNVERYITPHPHTLILDLYIVLE
jgi:hypothetical protein